MKLFTLKKLIATALLCMGVFESNAEIADALGIRENTLQKHLQNLFRKLNVTSKWEILRL